MYKKIKEYVLITIGMVMVAAGLYFFLMPNKLAIGGANGLAIVLNKVIPILSIGALMIIINIVLFIVGFLFIGVGFGIKTIYASFGISGTVWLFERIIPMQAPITNEMFLELFFGILISGVGMGIVFNQNASTGGTDIIAKILNKYFHIPLGKGVLMSDFTITIMAGLAFGPKLGMYALLGVIINGFVIDSTIEGFNRLKQVNIISDNYKEIKDYIMNKLERGATVYKAEGAYTEKDREVIVTVLDRRDLIKLKNFINEVDEDAFITVSDVHEVLGYGFKNING